MKLPFTCPCFHADLVVVALGLLGTGPRGTDAVAQDGQAPPPSYPLLPQGTAWLWLWWQAYMLLGPRFPRAACMRSLHALFLASFPGSLACVQVDLKAQVQPITRSILKVELTITPDFEFNPEIHGSG